MELCFKALPFFKFLSHLINIFPNGTDILEEKCYYFIIKVSGY